jgi:hypothetical protein
VSNADIGRAVGASLFCPIGFIGHKQVDDPHIPTNRPPLWYRVLRRTSDTVERVRDPPGTDARDWLKLASRFTEIRSFGSFTSEIDILAISRAWRDKRVYCFSSVVTLKSPNPVIIIVELDARLIVPFPLSIDS